MNYETILVAHHGASALITLNRPDKLNAMSMMLKAELVRALQELDNRDETRVIVITGAGDKAFTAGGEPHQFQGRPPVEKWAHYGPGPPPPPGGREAHADPPAVQRDSLRRGPRQASG